MANLCRQNILKLVQATKYIDNDTAQSYFPHIKNAIFPNLFLLRSRVPVFVLFNIQQT